MAVNAVARQYDTLDVTGSNDAVASSTQNASALRPAVCTVLAIISVLAMQGSWLSYPWHQSDSDRRQRVIPGAKQKGISATATVPAAASVSATPQHAVVLLFVNQSTTIGGSPPTTTTSSVKVTLEHVGSRWLVSDFIPV